MPSEKTVTKCSETRRSTKPIMEKRRRARINSSLSELKNLILDALKKDNARHSKLEKADILEMTVKHLQNLQAQQQQVQAVDPGTLGRFRAGFGECAQEVNRFLGGSEGGMMDHALKQRLLNHLANCLTGMNQPPAPLPPVHVQVAPQDAPSAHRVHLVPTRLPSGEIAFLLPAALYAPSTVPISPATSTTSSCSSPVAVLGSSGILSPAASDRSTSPLSSVSSTRMASPVPVMTSSPVSVISHCPAVVPQQQSKAVWRPF